MSENVEYFRKHFVTVEQRRMRKAMRRAVHLRAHTNLSRAATNGPSQGNLFDL